MKQKDRCRPRGSDSATDRTCPAAACLDGRNFCFDLVTVDVFRGGEVLERTVDQQAIGKHHDGIVGTGTVNDTVPRIQGVSCLALIVIVPLAVVQSIVGSLVPGAV